MNRYGQSAFCALCSITVNNTVVYRSVMGDKGSVLLPNLSICLIESKQVPSLEKWGKNDLFFVFTNDVTTL